MGNKKRKEVFKYWYRSVLTSDPNGVWCESSNLDEVVRMSKGYDTTISRMTIWLVYDPWKPMSEKKIARVLKRVRSLRKARFSRGQ